MRIPSSRWDGLKYQYTETYYYSKSALPLFLPVQLFGMTKFPDREENPSDLAILYFTNDFFPHCDGLQFCSRISDGEAIHLLDLMHKSWCYSFAATLPEIKDLYDNPPFEFIKSTLGLQLRVIKFEKAEKSISWLRITFKNGVIKIPPFPVGDVTETFFRNLVAYEEYILTDYEDYRCVTDCVTFMDFLIDSDGDVEKHRHRWIVRNWIGDDAAVSTMFSKLA
ncbi:uncharacterized protein [Coffea arabica]|uniref:Uncharacterized protein n=1 Tax=Coffea arabica TaxID=13443 RepID=A0A6P6X1Q9_COFAR|nr:uncharacterized protein LOC113737959 [Coffea arabica]